MLMRAGGRLQRRHLALLLVGVLCAALAVAGWTHASPDPVAAPPGPSPSVAPASPAPTPVPRAAAARVDRPNVVVVMADDMRADDLRFMPHVRRLVAGTGLTFRNSFSPYPLCCPARASFLTGQLPHNHRVLSHLPPWGFGSFDDRRTLATALQDGGYQTGFVGKYLNGYGLQDSRVTGRSSFTYVPAGWTDWFGAVERPPGTRFASGGAYDYFHTLFNVNGTVRDRWDGKYQTTVLGRMARRLVARYHRSPQPFFLWVNPVAPHFGAPFEADDPGRRTRVDGGTTFLDTPARPPWVRGRFDRTVTRAAGLPVDGSSPESDVRDKPRGVRGQLPISADERAGMLALTRQRAEALAVLDLEVRRLLRTLATTGELDETVFVFTSDNGYFLGEHRMRQGKVKPHEPSLRVPLLMTGAGVPHGERFDPVTTPGLTATIAELAGVTSRMPDEPDAVSVVPSMTADRGWTVPVVVEAVDGGVRSATSPRRRAAGFTDARNTIGIRTGRWKYVRYVTGDVELYDLDADPNELRNLARRPAYAAERARLQQVWQDYRRCAGATCRAPLPVELRREASENASATDAQSRGVQQVFGLWR